MTLSNGENVPILEPSDFEEVLDTYLGMETAHYFHDFIHTTEEVSSLELKVDDLESKVEDLTFDLDHAKEEYKDLEE